MPEAKSANERIGWVAFAATRRKLFQLVDVAIPENHGLEGGDLDGDHAVVCRVRRSKRLAVTLNRDLAGRVDGSVVGIACIAFVGR